ncbi:hypothetical protein C8Q74DRAFT_1438657, partial [Fomes fomentarius]
MSAATIAEPFLLSSYPESSAHRKRKLAPLYASPPSGRDAEPFVTLAVQGDGVHVLDTSTLHPAVSHTLGPSTFYSSTPATRTRQYTSGSRICTTYAVLESGRDVQPEGGGKTVVAWEESLIGGMSSGTQSKKRVAVAPHPVAHLYAPEYLPDREIFVSSAGEVSLANEELRVVRTFTPQNQQVSTLVKHVLFPAASCTLLPSHAIANHAAISVSFLRSGEVLRFSVVGVAQEELTALAECVVPVEETDILDISCSSQGFISVLLTSGTWLALSVSSPSTSSLTISQVAEPLCLQNLTFVNSTRASEVSLSALTSSYVLLSAVSTGSVPEIVLLLWDLRYGVLLSQQSLSVPSTLPRPKKHGAVLQLLTSPAIPPTSGSSQTSALNLNALLVLLPVAERDMQTQAETGTGTGPRSTLLVVPLTVPTTSTIAAAMGKAHAGARWVSPKSAQGQQAQGLPVRGAPELGAAARKALREIKASLDGNANGKTEGAEGVYFEYVKQMSRGKATTQRQGLEAESQSTPVDYPFVQGVLELVLRPPSVTAASGEGKAQKACAYSPKIVSHLLENRMVSSSMVDGGLLPALAARHDWNTVALAMRMVTDLPENDIIALLGRVVVAHRHASSGDEDAMQVDSAPLTSTPSLPTFLAQCIVYSFTPALQRTALRKHIPDAADLMSILEILDKWLVQHTDDDALLSDISVSTSSDSPSSIDVPPLDKILLFLQTVLDASFIALLAHSPAHPLLRTLAAHVQPALASAHKLELLCGPLEPFARAAAPKTRAQAQAQTEGKDGGGIGGGRGSWRMSRRAWRWGCIRSRSLCCSFVAILDGGLLLVWGLLL